MNQKVACTSVTHLVLLMFSRITGIISDPVEIYALEGSPVNLPCNMSGLGPKESVKVVLWFRNCSFEGSPIYSVDYRSGEEKHMTRDEDPLRGRIVFNQEDQFNRGLRISSFKASDSGFYACRVDYNKTNKLCSHLRVLEPPQSLIILDNETNRTLEEKSVFNENTKLNLICLQKGGQPQATIRWLMNETVVESDEKLTLLLSRQHIANTQLTCEAFLRKFGSVKNATIRIDLNLMPLNVTIESPEHFRSGIKEKVVCFAFGSKPMVKFSWKLDGKPINSLAYVREFEQSYLSARSELFFSASPQDNRKNLTCNVFNPKFPGRVLSTHQNLNVWELSILNSPNSTEIFQENDKIQLFCNTSASNPGVREIIWYKNSIMLTSNNDEDFRINGEELLIRKASRRDRGTYYCQVKNDVGLKQSNNVSIIIHYSPICTHQKILYTMLPDKVLSIVCEVEAEPPQVTFRWSKNGKALPPSWSFSVFQEGTKGYLNLTKVDHLPANLDCVANNSVGESKEACTKTVSPPKSPGAPYNCSIYEDVCQLICQPGIDPLGDVIFVVTIFRDEDLTQSVKVIESRKPVFPLNSVKVNNTYQFEIHAKNDYGKSKSVVIRFRFSEINLTVPSASSIMSRNSLYFILYSGLVIILVTVLLFLTIYRWFRNKSQVKVDPQAFESSNCNSMRGQAISYSPKENSIHKETLINYKTGFIQEEQALMKACEPDEKGEKLQDSSEANLDRVSREMISSKIEAELARPCRTKIQSCYSTSV